MNAIKLLGLSLLFTGVSMAWTATPSSSAPAPPSGSIDTVEENLTYGDIVHFDTSVSGRVAAKAYLYNNVVCVQGDTVVYQASNMDLSAGFVLVDQDGQNLVWDGGAAICYGTLVYRIDGRNPTIEYLDQTTFEVGP